MAMAERLHDATAELRVRFNKDGFTQEFSAKIRAEKFLPMVVDVHKDSVINKKDPGGVITIETRAPLNISRRVVKTLPRSAEDVIDRWIANKREDLQAKIADLVSSGWTDIHIDNNGSPYASSGE